MRPGEKLFEELNLHHESLVPTSHNKIRSYVDNHHLNSKQVKEIIQLFQGIVEDQDVASLVRLVKELVPSYSPGSNMLKTVMLAQLDHDNPVDVQVNAVQVESNHAASLIPAVRINQLILHQRSRAGLDAASYCAGRYPRRHLTNPQTRKSIGMSNEGQRMSEAALDSQRSSWFMWGRGRIGGPLFTAVVAVCCISATAQSGISTTTDSR